MWMAVSSTARMSRDEGTALSDVRFGFRLPFYASLPGPQKPVVLQSHTFIFKHGCSLKDDDCATERTGQR